MVRVIVERIIDSNKRYIVAAGLSSDDKPLENIITGSRFLEVDTGIVCAYDETNQAWFALGKSNYTYENWTTDTGNNVTDSNDEDIDLRIDPNES